MIIFYLIMLFVIILPIILPTKCPKCDKKCSESYYFSGAVDSMYYACPEHGDINKLNNE